MDPIGPKLGQAMTLSVRKHGGQGRNRTADASLFRAALYQLSYLATENGLSEECLLRQGDYNNAGDSTPNLRPNLPRF